MFTTTSSKISKLQPASSTTAMRKALRSMSNRHREAFYKLPADLQRQWRSDHPDIVEDKSRMLADLHAIWSEAKQSFFDLVPADETNKAIFLLLNELALGPWTRANQKQIEIRKGYLQS